jgi:nicotinate-nucleotide adenylyltransferase
MLMLSCYTKLIIKQLMEIGLYFGSFNPIHIGHLIIANHILNTTAIDKIWFIVSPQNPLKKSESLLGAPERLNLVKLAIENNSRFEVSDIEFHLPRPSYTINTLSSLKNTFPQNTFYLIIGSDNYLNFSKWKSSHQLKSEHHIFVYQRPGFPLAPEKNSLNIRVFDAPLLDISSTSIRQLIRDRKSIRYLVPEPVYIAIEVNNYFK